MTNSSVKGNIAQEGGGFRNRDGGTLTLMDSTVSGNTAALDGGGIFSRSGTVSLINTIVSGNTANIGGGISNTGTADLTSSTISGNTGFRGGGIFNGSGGSLNVINSTINDNSASGDGAGIFGQGGGTVTLTNSTVSMNTATTGGGGIDNSGTLALTNSTLSGNAASGSFGGGGIFNNVTITLVNTIFAGNTAPTGPDCGGTGSLASQGHNLIGNNSGCNFSPASGDQVNVDPLLGALADNGGPTKTHALLTGSPAIDTGDDSVLGSPLFLTTDQRGFPRLQGAHVDIGAYEAPATDAPQTSPITVTKTGDSNDGLCGVGDCSLREAIASGDSGDAINIPLGVYTLTLGTELTINQNLTLTGAGSGDTIIQAATDPSTAGFRVLSVSRGDVVISGVTIRYGGGAANGGGIQNDSIGTLGLTNVTVSGNDSGGINNSGTLTINNSSIVDNTTGGPGGGLFNHVAGTMMLTNSTVSGNSAASGGGIFNDPDGTLAVTNSTISGNSAFNLGGGIFNDGGTVTVTDSTVSDNRSNGVGSDGGGILNDSNGTLALTNSTVSGNTTRNDGGGILNGGTLTMTNSTVSGNSATGDGGGIFNESGTVSLTNTTVSGNAATGDGGGIWYGAKLTLTNTTVADNTSTSTGGGLRNTVLGTADLRNTIIANNPSGNDCSWNGNLASSGNNLDSDGSCPLSVDSGDLPNTDPDWGPFQDNGGPTKTHALLPGSPAIDAGDDGVLGPPHNLTTDQRGEPRQSGIRVDIGAYELQAPPPPPLPRMPSFQQQLDILSGDGVPPELAHSAIEQLPAMLLGTPVVLPTSGGQVSMETWMETVRFFDRATTDLENAINVLTGVKMGNAAQPPHSDPGVRSHANQVSVLLEASLSVIRGLAHQVAGIDPAGTIPPHLRKERQRVEGPFLPMAPVGFGQFPIERTEVCNVDSGESSSSGTDAGGSFTAFSSHSSACIITKESFGVKAVLFHRIIPIYQEPWDVRERPIIGHEVVWYIRWMPAEHIKTIIYEQDPSTGRVKIRVRQHDVLMPGLSKFWSFYPP